jgi:hypothetical protein
MIKLTNEDVKSFKPIDDNNVKVGDVLVVSGSSEQVLHFRYSKPYIAGYKRDGKDDLYYVLRVVSIYPEYKGEIRWEVDSLGSLGGSLLILPKKYAFLKVPESYPIDELAAESRIKTEQVLIKAGF